MRYWKKVRSDGTTKAVESYSHSLKVNRTIEITKEEFDGFVSSLPEPEPPRDLASEIDELRALNSW